MASSVIISPQKGISEIGPLNQAQLMVEKMIHSNCGICMDWLIQPVFLPCGHFFCHECLITQAKNIPDHQGGVRCAVCRYEFGKFNSYDQDSKKKLIDNIRPQQELGMLIELLAGPEYKDRINQKAKKKIREKIIEYYCCSPRASQIQDVIKKEFVNNESLNIKVLSENLNCPIEEIYYHLLIYCSGNILPNGEKEKGWMESNQPNFLVWNQRYLFFKDYVIDTNSLGEMTPLLLIDTQIMDLSITEKYYLSLLSAGKSHWKYHCKQPTCEGVRMVFTHMENLEKQQKENKLSCFFPFWLSDYRSNPAPAWMEIFYQLIEKLDQEENRILNGSAAEAAFLQEQRRREKERKKNNKEVKLLQKKGVQIVITDDQDNQPMAEAKLDLSWKELAGFGEIPDLIKKVTSKKEVSDQAKTGLACHHCSEYPCQCSHCEICRQKVLECRCYGNVRPVESDDSSIAPIDL